MTAPLRASDPIVVNVALGERSYDIVIGRGQLALLGEKIAVLRPGAAQLTCIRPASPLTISSTILSCSTSRDCTVRSAKA